MPNKFLRKITRKKYLKKTYLLLAPFLKGIILFFIILLIYFTVIFLLCAILMSARNRYDFTIFYYIHANPRTVTYFNTIFVVKFINRIVRFRSTKIYAPGLAHYCKQKKKYVSCSCNNVFASHFVLLLAFAHNTCGAA